MERYINISLERKRTKERSRRRVKRRRCPLSSTDEQGKDSSETHRQSVWSQGKLLTEREGEREEADILTRQEALPA